MHWSGGQNFHHLLQKWCVLLDFIMVIITVIHCVVPSPTVILLNMWCIMLHQGCTGPMLLGQARNGLLCIHIYIMCSSKLYKLTFLLNFQYVTYNYILLLSHGFHASCMKFSSKNFNHNYSNNGKSIFNFFKNNWILTVYQNQSGTKIREVANTEAL